MPTNAPYQYFESRILSADPVELIEILYEAAIDSVGKAAGHLREGNIAARSKAISRAHAILVELGFSVNREADPKLAANLIELYDYMERRLNEANFQQTEAPLAEVARLLRTLLEGWVSCRTALASPPPAAAPGEEAEYAGRSWTA
jgi:flagellar protein FliS